MRVDGVTAHFWSDQAGPDAGEGVAVPESWTVQALVEGEWQDVTGADGVPDRAPAPNAVTFDAVVTTGIRAVLTAQSDGDGTAVSGSASWRSSARRSTPRRPRSRSTATGVEGANGWYLSPVTVRATATDDRDVRTRIEVAVDAGAWQATDNVRFVEADGHRRRRAHRQGTGDRCRGERLGGGIRRRPHRLDEAHRRRHARHRRPHRERDRGGRRIGHRGHRVRDRRADGLAGLRRAACAVDEQRHVVYLRSKDAAGNVSTLSTVTVPLSSTAPLEGNIAPIATPTASYTSGWNSVTAVNDGSLTGASWGTWPNVGEQWVQLEWDRVVTVDRAGVLFFRDSTDPRTRA